MKSHPLQGSFVHKSDFVRGCYNERMHRFIFACEQFRNTLSFYPLTYIEAAVVVTAAGKAAPTAALAAVAEV